MNKQQIKRQIRRNEIDRMINNLSICPTCNCMTKSIQSYKEILKPKYKKVNYLICGKCKGVKKK